jgi:hypothetical protein
LGKLVRELRKKLNAPLCKYAGRRGFNVEQACKAREFVRGFTMRRSASLRCCRRGTGRTAPGTG